MDGLPDDVLATVNAFLAYTCVDCRASIAHTGVARCVNTHAHSTTWRDGHRVCNYGYLCAACAAVAQRHGGRCDQCCWDDIT